jgi:DNA-binding XRE family transcriptional regulator
MEGKMPKALPVTEKNKALYELIESVNPKMSVPRIASAIGISQTTLYNLINKRINPTAETAEKIGKFFRVDPRDIFGMNIIPKAN